MNNKIINAILSPRKSIQMRKINSLTEKKYASDKNVDQFNNYLISRHIDPNQIDNCRKKFVYLETKSYKQLFYDLQRENDSLKEEIVNRSHDLATKNETSRFKIIV